ncbi:MAG TPA: DUF2867 domain-containing protein [Mycobacterium sp.]|nr:DUF2867 domain-containing protein [Mycobacterium sp.]HUH67848.1 DUF2867 domain-containing protein [Mycobacterium sp.]
MSPQPVAVAVRNLALSHVRDWELRTRWSRADGEDAPSQPLPTDPEWAGDTLYDDVRQRRTDPATLWRVIESIGADHGMSASPLAWSLRGWIGQLTSAAGIRRGSRNAHRLHSGEALDWWRVEHIDGPDSCGYVPTSHCQADSGWNCPRDPTRKEVPSTANVYRFNPVVIAGQAFWNASATLRDAVVGGIARDIASAAHERPAR